MLISCNNKGCLKTSNALYDQTSKEVLCEECGKSISNVSEAMKRTLSSYGQIVRTEQRKGFLMACKSCNANRQVVLDQDNNTICKQCNGPIVVQKAFLSAMESTGALERVVVERNTPDEVDKTSKPAKPSKAKRKKLDSND